MRFIRVLAILCFLAVSSLATIFAQDDATVLLSGNDTLGQFLTDADGNTLYIFTNDTASVSNCSGDCLGAWPALTVDSADALVAGEGIVGEFGVIEREDTGELQVTYNRQALYTFVNDAAPGDTAGQGAGDVWFVARPQVIGLGGNDELGSFLTDASGNTLYIFTNDSEGVSNCTGDCLGAWPALTVATEADLVAGLGAVAQDDLSTISRPDTGELQVTYQGQPLYTFANDLEAGQAVGQGVGDVWFVVNPSPVNVSDNDALGSILTGRDGTTLYTFTNDSEGVSNCTEVCADIWPPLTVTSATDLDSVDAALAGSLSVITRDDDSLQVALNGAPLYYYILDGAAGDTVGEGAGDVWFVATSDVAASSDSSSVCTATSASNINQRQGPGTNYFLAGALVANTPTTVIGQAQGLDGFVWWTLEGNVWVRSDLVTLEGNCDSLPTIAAPPPPPPPTAAPVEATSAPDQPAPPPPPPPSTTEEP